MRKNVPDKDLFKKFAVPMMLRGVLNSMMHTADRLVAALFIGASALVATTLASPLMYFVYAVSALFIGGLGAYVGLLIGREQSAKASEMASGILSVLGIVGVILCLPTVFFNNEIATWLGASGELHEMTSQYLKIFAISFPLMLLGRSLDVLICNDGRPDYSFKLNMLTTSMNFILNVLTVVIFDMGIQGLALATVFSEGVQTLGGLMYFKGYRLWSLMGKESKLKPQILQLCKPTIEIKVFLRIMYNGLSDFSMLLVDSVMVLVINVAFITYLTPQHFEAYAVVNIIMTLFYAIFMGAAGGLQPLFSQWMGSGRYSELSPMLNYSIKKTAIIGGGVYMMVLPIAKPLLSLFLGTGIALEHGWYFYITLGFVVLFSNIPLQTSLFYTAINRPIESAVISILRTLVMIPLFGYLGIMLLGAPGLAIGFFITDLILMLALMVYMKKIDYSKLTVLE